MSFGKLPPFGKRLVALRNQGKHPARVWVIVGDDWSRRPASAPYLFVPAGAGPGSYDWSILAGLRVHVVEREGSGLWVAAEIAEFAAPVVLHMIPGEECWPYIPGKPAQIDLSDAMYAMRQPVEGLFKWPVQWSDRKEEAYQARKRAYLRALLGDALGSDEAVA